MNKIMGIESKILHMVSNCEDLDNLLCSINDAKDDLDEVFLRGNHETLIHLDAKRLFVVSDFVALSINNVKLVNAFNKGFEL